MTSHRNDGIRLELRAVRRVRSRDLLVRFAFGAGVSALAGTVTVLLGPFPGGVLLAFPAILVASLTLVAKEEGLRSSRDDARGAALGTFGLLAFALATAVLMPRVSAWVALPAATAAWAVVAGSAYAVARITGHGGDEGSPEEDGRQRSRRSMDG
ncbi:DUF3147 family protein [Kitasatospora sp. HPMI-4]|uniref:DUF3147 family protein n=1 Tax=Kitasatospora sp. HPMI-4 TaxID=3448443 RepID=UPI003F1C8F7E